MTSHKEAGSIAPTGALAGVRVIDCTHVIAGAWCSALLADLGADVIKIEPPQGEMTRDSGDRKFRPFDFVNRNKRTISLDLSKAEGVAVLAELADTADVFVENFRPGALDRLGLGYDMLAARNPGLVYCSVSGFGHDGPYRERGGFDLIAQAMSGIMSLTGIAGESEPVAAGVPISDLNAGVFAALGVMAALNERHRSGQGQRVETTLLEAAMSYTLWETGVYLTEGLVAGPVGTQHRLAAPYEALKAADGHIVVGVNNPKLWQRFCDAIGLSALSTDPRFADNNIRVANRAELRVLLEAQLASESVATWTERLVAVGIPCGPINDVAQAAADPQVAHRGFFVETEGRTFARAPLVMSRTPVAIRRGPGELGQHTYDVLREAGMDQQRIDALAAEGVIITAKEDSSHG